MPTPNLSTHSARKSHITTLAHTYFSSPAFQLSHAHITRYLVHTHTPTFSNPHPTSLERPRTWRTCWSTIVYEDEKDGRWWASIDAGSLPYEIQMIGFKVLHDLRSRLSLDLKTTKDCQIHEEERCNPFRKGSSDISWDVAKYTPDKHLIRGEEEGWTYRLKVILRWTDNSWIRFREKTVWVGFHVPPHAQPPTRMIRKNEKLEIEHLEYAEIEYSHDDQEKRLHRSTSTGSDRTLVGLDEEGMSDEEVKVWASQFGVGRRKGGRRGVVG